MICTAFTAGRAWRTLSNLRKDKQLHILAMDCSKCEIFTEKSNAMVSNSEQVEEGITEVAIRNEAARAAHSG